jgi:hypothetical protein
MLSIPGKYRFLILQLERRSGQIKKDQESDKSTLKDAISVSKFVFIDWFEKS